MYAWVVVKEIRKFGRERVIVALRLRPSTEEGNFGFGAQRVFFWSSGVVGPEPRARNGDSSRFYILSKSIPDRVGPSWASETA